MSAASKSAGEALSSGRAGLGLEPRDELGDGEGLGKGGARAGAGASLSGCGGSGDLGSGGSSGGLSGGALGRCRGRGAARVRAGAAGSTIPHLRAGDVVSSAAVSSALDIAVDVAENTGVLGRVGLGEVDTGGQLGRARASDLDLTTAVVELGLARSAGLVETDHLRADVVLARGKVGERNLNETLVLDEVVDTPGGTGKTVLLDLDPDVTLTLGLGRGKVDHGGSLVGGGDGLVLVATGVTSTVVVVPLEGDLGASGDFEEVGSLSTTIADHGLGGDIEDGVVAVGRGLDSLVLTLVFAVNDERLEGGVAVGKLGSGEGESDSGLHFDCWLVVGLVESGIESMFQRMNERMEDEGRLGLKASGC